jgi:hypothetical protein
MWNGEMEIIPAIIGAIGTITKLCRKYMSNINENTTRNRRQQPHWTLHTYFGK